MSPYYPKKCVHDYLGTTTLEVGARAGAFVGANLGGYMEANFSDPINFGYKVGVGVSGYVGAELYFSATGAGSGTLKLNR